MGAQVCACGYYNSLFLRLLQWASQDGEFEPHIGHESYFKKKKQIKIRTKSDQSMLFTDNCALGIMQYEK